MKRAFYVSDEILNTALVGIDHKALNSAALPEALHETAAAITALSQEPADATWALTCLVFAYEAAYNDCPVNSFSPEQMAQYRAALAAGADAEGQDTVAGNVADDAAASGADTTLITRIKLHQGPLPVAPCTPEPSGQRYLSAELMALLNSYRSDPVAWLDILARLQGTGLKVPLLHSKTFVQTYFKLRSKLNALYAALPCEFLSQRAHYLLPYISAVAVRQVNEASVDLARKQGTVAWYQRLASNWRHGNATLRHGALSSLLAHYELERMLDLIESDFKSLDEDERDDLLQLILEHWVAQLTHCYQAGTWSGDLPQRLAKWLGELVAHDSSDRVKTAAAQLLRLLPGVGWQEDMTALARKILVATWKKGKFQLAYRVKLTSKEVVTPLCTFVPELKNSLQFRKHGSVSFGVCRENEESYFLGFTFLLPPALWFELFALERSGDDAADAAKLFAAFAQHFPGFIAQKQGYRSWRFDNCFLYLITRIRFELGELYLKAFYQHCGAMLSLEVVQDFIADTSYAERESLLWVLQPELFAQLDGHRLLELRALIDWAQVLASKPASCWGPKFSTFIMAQIWFYLSPKNLAKIGSSHYGNGIKSGFSAIGLSLDPTVKASFCAHLKELITSFSAEIAEREQLIEPLKDTVAREDIARRERYVSEKEERQKAVEMGQHLLLACAAADRINKLCAAEVERARLGAAEA